MTHGGGFDGKNEKDNKRWKSMEFHSILSSTFEMTCDDDERNTQQLSDLKVVQFH